MNTQDMIESWSMSDASLVKQLRELGDPRIQWGALTIACAAELIPKAADALERQAAEIDHWQGLAAGEAEGEMKARLQRDAALAERDRLRAERDQWVKGFVREAYPDRDTEIARLVYRLAEGAAMSKLCKHEHTGSRRIGGVLKEVTCTKCGTVVWNEELSWLRAELAGRGWQSVETAPRDGTHILVCAGPYRDGWGFNQRPPIVVHWWEYEGDCGFYLSSGIVADSYNDKPIGFTHWMPLPEPPK